MAINIPQSKVKPIQKFGSKMLAASKAINSIPPYFLKKAINTRIYDGGIGPRKGTKKLTHGTLIGSTKGSFTMNGELYQIVSGMIYKVNQYSGEQTLLPATNLGYDQIVDSLVFDFVSQTFETKSSYINPNYNIGQNIIKMRFNRAQKRMEFYDDNDVMQTSIDLTSYNITSKTRIGIWQITPNNNTYDTTSSKLNQGTGTYQRDGTSSTFWYYVLDDTQYMYCLNYPSNYWAEQLYINLSIMEPSRSSSTMCLLASSGQNLRGFDGTTIFNLEDTPINSGIVEFAFNYVFLAVGSTLYVSAPITPEKPENAYNFTGDDALPEITLDAEIVSLKSTMRGLYVFTKKYIYFISGSNLMRDAVGKPILAAIPLGENGYPISNQLVATSGDKIFYITKELTINTINYIEGTAEAGLGTLSNMPLVGIQELMNSINKNQDNGFAFTNRDDGSVHFFLKSGDSEHNNFAIIYDLINESFAVDDENRGYNFVTQTDIGIFGFYDFNSAVTQDNTGSTDNQQDIICFLDTQELNLGSLKDKLFNGFYNTGWFSIGTLMKIEVFVDRKLITTMTKTAREEREKFEFLADATRIKSLGEHIQFRITVKGQELENPINKFDFLLDGIGVGALPSGNKNLKQKF